MKSQGRLHVSGPGGERGYSHFFFICRLGLSIYCLPKIIRNIKHPKNLKFLQPQKISHSVHLPLRKDPKIHRNDTLTSPIFDDPPPPLKCQYLLFTPKNIRNIKHPQKIFEIFATQKITPFCIFTLRKRP